MSRHAARYTPGWQRRQREAQAVPRCPTPAKRRFADRGVAEAATKPGYTTVRPLRAYFCEGCKGWHLTSKERL